MNVLGGFIELIRSDPVLKKTVGGRIRSARADKADQEGKKSYVVCQMTNTDHPHHLRGHSGLITFDIVVDCYSESGADAVRIKERIRIMLDTIDHGVILIVPPEISDRVEPFVQSLVQPGTSYLIEGRIRNADGVAIGSFQVPALLGRAVGVWCGHQTSRVSDWDVDVANECAIANPEIRAVIDGYGMRLELNQSPQGTLQLDVSAKLQFLSAQPHSQDLGTADRRSWDPVKCRTRSIEDLRYLPARGGEVQFEDSRLTLTLKVTPQQAQ